MRYAAVLGVSARQALSARGAIVARSAFFVVILLIFASLWEAVREGGGFAGIGAKEFLWYLVLTEWVVLGVPHLYLAIEEDVRRGDIAYRIARPVSYLGMKLAEGVGEVCARMLWLAPVGFVSGWLLAGGLPAEPRGLLLAVPLCVLSAFVFVVIQTGIGLLTFWMQEASPVHWVVQKLVFVFGGLMFPLDVYPDWMRAISRLTPFEPLIYGCGRMALGYDPALAAWIGLWIVAWGLVFLAALVWLYRKSLRVLDVNGG